MGEVIPCPFCDAPVTDLWSMKYHLWDKHCDCCHDGPFETQAQVVRWMKKYYPSLSSEITADDDT